jgi:hypothetical protein
MPPISYRRLHKCGARSWGLVSWASSRRCTARPPRRRRPTSPSTKARRCQCAVSPDGRTLAVDSAGQHLDAARGRRNGDADYRSLQRRSASRPGRPTGKWDQPSSGTATAATTSGPSRRMAHSNTSSRGDPSTTASRPGRTTGRAWRSRRTAVIRSAATTTSGRSIRDPASSVR